MLTMELLLREIRDRIVFMRVDGITMPTNHNALLFDAEEPFLDQYYYVGDWRDLPSLAPEGCDGSCFFCAGGESLAHDAQPDISYRNLVVFSGSVIVMGLFHTLPAFYIAGAVQGLSQRGRHCPYPFPLGHLLCPGRPRHPGLRHHSR